MKKIVEVITVQFTSSTAPWCMEELSCKSLKEAKKIADNKRNQLSKDGVVSIIISYKRS